MLNRAALILRYKQPFVHWINAVDPSPGSHTLSLADVEEERTVYLVEVEDPDDLKRWLARNHKWLFEEELNGWYTDPTLWSRDRSLKKVKDWCSLRAQHGGDRHRHLAARRRRPLGHSEHLREGPTRVRIQDGATVCFIDEGAFGGRPERQRESAGKGGA